MTRGRDEGSWEKKSAGLYCPSIRHLDSGHAAGRGEGENERDRACSLVGTGWRAVGKKERRERERESLSVKPESLHSGTRRIPSRFLLLSVTDYRPSSQAVRAWDEFAVIEAGRPSDRPIYVACLLICRTSLSRFLHPRPTFLEVGLRLAPRAAPVPLHRKHVFRLAAWDGVDCSKSRIRAPP